jgi:hypothetical protein
MAPEANLTEWNVNKETDNSGPSLERMVRTICFCWITKRGVE